MTSEAVQARLQQQQQLRQRQQQQQHHQTYRKSTEHNTNTIAAADFQATHLASGSEIAAAVGKENIDDDPNSKQHHVGPVMGIFFKVWSLVKVTKMRNHQRMRRQNSADNGTAQFQYIAGDRLSASMAQQGASSSGLLQDGHFRRAGSQPAPSTSSRIGTFEPAMGPISQNTRLMMQANSDNNSAATKTTPSNTGTHSTSSGVSSSTSSTLANVTTPPSGSSSSGFRRHMSAYSLRRPAAGADTPPAQVVQQQKRGAAGGAKLSQLRSNGAGVSAGNSSWAAKIKRSATTVNQADLSSYMSRYRFRNQHQARDRRPSISGRDERMAEAKPQKQQPLEEQQLNGAREEILSDDNDGNDVNDEYNDDDDDNNNIDDIEDEEDSNDIYSTPNDSIQSVPSTAPVICTEQVAHSGLAVHQITSQAYPIIKSFSTNNFGHLIKQQQQHHSIMQPTTGHQKFKPIDELRPTTSSNDNNTPDLKHQDSNHSSNNKNRLNGSRFFISSSSSEDSNTSPNQPQLHQHHAHQDQRNGRHQPQHQAHFQLEQRLHQIPLQLDVHYHAPMLPVRPDSLCIGGACQDNSTAGPAVFLFTPTSTTATATATAAGYPIAAMSPMDHGRAPAFGSNQRMAAFGAAYRKSPSLFEISNHGAQLLGARYSAKYPPINYFRSNRPNSGPLGLGVAPVSSFRPSSVAPPMFQSSSPPSSTGGPTQQRLPNSISLHDCCKLPNGRNQEQSGQSPQSAQTSIESQEEPTQDDSEYRLAQMMLEFGANPNAKDAHGCTALMYAVMSDNLPAIKCLVEHGANLDETNHSGLGVLDLVCSRAPTAARLEMLKLLIDSQAELDRARASDGTRLLDRLIREHDRPGSVNNDKLPFIDLLLQSGAKLGSSTWSAAIGKQEIQFRLLKKVCQDGYYLYKKSLVEAAVYRFEYALKRLTDFEQQLAQTTTNHYHSQLHSKATPALTTTNKMDNQRNHHQLGTQLMVRKIKFQTYLGLSRCEHKRKFYKRALEFAHLAILVDSTAYEGYYSKAHILKDLGKLDDSLIAIDQTARLVDKSIESLTKEMMRLKQQEESMLLELSRQELSSNLEYLQEAKRFISRLKSEMNNGGRGSSSQEPQATIPPSCVNSPMSV